MKISLVIPHMPSPITDDLLDQCVESFKGQYDELIIISNDGMGYGPAVNLGLKYSTGDYIVVSNNDITSHQGKLKNLAYTEGISVPIIRPMPRDWLPRAIFCIPRWLYDSLMKRDGFFYDPRFETGYFEDDDLHKRIEDIPKFVALDIIVDHLNGGGTTMKQMGEQHWFDTNQKVFNDKWS